MDLLAGDTFSMSPAPEPLRDDVAAEPGRSRAMDFDFIDFIDCLTTFVCLSDDSATSLGLALCSGVL